MRTMDMRYLTLFTLLLVLAISPPVFSQDDTKNEEIYIGFEYLRRNVEVRLPNQTDFQFDEANDSLGGRFEYTHFIGKSNKNNPFGIGIRAGTTFHTQDVSGTRSCGAGCTITSTGTSKVAHAYANYFARLQGNRGGGFQPYVEGTVGVSKTDFGGSVVVLNVGTFNGKTSYNYGFGGGFDIKMNRRTKWRIGADYLNTGFEDGRRHNLQFHTGIVFVFGN